MSDPVSSDVGHRSGDRTGNRRADTGAIESLDDPAGRAESILKWSVREVPFYARHPSRIAEAPFIDSLTVRLHWDQLTRRGAEHDLDDARKAEQRFSSGSTSATKLRTVVEREVWKRRRGYENVVLPGPLARAKFLLGRPENLDLFWRGGVVSKRGPCWVAVSPGPDPTAVKDDDWDRVVELLVREEPDCVEGDPAYLSGLARRCLAHRVQLRGLSRVVVGHSFCWRIYAEPIEKAFRQPARSSLATSELGTIGVTCDEGRLHLLETGVFFELVARGRAVREGEIGALVATTLDTQLRPLVRYTNGDAVRLIASACRCGRPYRVIEYEGRIANLLADPRSRFVTCRDIDVVIGAPAGVSYFKLREAKRGFVLDLLTASRASAPAAELRSSLEERLGRHVTVRFVDSFGPRSTGKHLALETYDHYEAGLTYFLGTASRLARRRGAL